MSMDGSYHRQYDHCLAKWLNQAGVKTQYVEPESAGISGNGHQMMLEKNSLDIAKYIGTWLSTNARPGRGENNSRAMPNPRTHPDLCGRGHRAQGLLLRRRRVLGRSGSPGDARCDVHRGLGAEADPASESDRVVPRQRTDRCGLAADA